MTTLDQFIGLAETGSVTDMFDHLCRMAEANVGAIIFSCSTFDTASHQAKRVYTNQPETYPLSGLKDMVPNRWTKKVLERGEPFFANSIGEIANVFPDHELIASLGCGSVINVPIRLNGLTLGTINLLHEAGHYTERRVQEAMQLRPPAMITFAAMTIDGHLQTSRDM